MRNHPLALALRFICKKHPITEIPIANFTTSTPPPLSSQTPFLPIKESYNKRFELADLLQSCISKNKSHLRKIHALIISSGFQSDTFINNILLNQYSKSSFIYDARHLFDQMPQKNLITWSSIISGYTQHGHGEEALTLFSRFRRSSFENPNEFIFASVLRACRQLRAAGCATQVHSLVTKSGFESDVYVGTALVDFYSKNGDIDEARLVFDEIPVRNAVTWTAIITGYSQAGRSEVSLQLFNQLRETNVRPDRYVLSSIISACSILEFLEGGKQIHGYILRNGTETDVSVNNVLIDFYSKCRRVKIAHQIFDHMVDKNVVSWTTMIAGYMQNACDQEAMELFSEMSRLGWRPDGFTCTSILTSCGSTTALEQGKQVHSYTIKTNLASDEFVKNGLIDMYAKCNSLADARNAFDDVVEHNVVSYNAMIEGYARDGAFLEALSLFSRMRFRSLSPSLLTFVSLLGASAVLSTVDLSKQIHGLMLKFGVSLDIYAGSALVDVYSKCSCVNDARAVFEAMDGRDIVVWNAMVFGYALNGQGEDALKLYLQLQLARMKPNEFTFVALVSSASNLASLLHGLQFHDHIIKAGLDSDPYVSNALIDMYAKCGSLNEARKLFDTMHGRDVVCWNSMISRYAQHGHAQEALIMFEQMQEEEIKPNYVTFVGVLSACSHVGLLEKGLRYFDSMKYDHDIEPGMEHYACMVALLGRFGKLREAKEFIERMPIEPAAVVWRSLLSACQMAGDVNIGKYAAEAAISIDPTDSGSYVLLSNIFASKGMWADVEKVRKGMNCNGVMKEPGHSWIEVKNEVHVFAVRDRMHSQADFIYEALDRLTEQIRGIGYAPDMTSPLMDD
ncbi:pentatricopeptide repeat-containing protein At4g39530 [Magnolia sinica]|uniref:pentatricopeptide repeat-containing protein At4g39530 n=1 Tax=Magnolia sinica TaxID=86752 RepID=UPI002657DBDA|nr:pentatricopeptide repeat-containing protein At4g39530 [Magnolia sinica]